MLRPARRAPGTALAQAMFSLRKRLDQNGGAGDEFLASFDACAMTLAREELAGGIACLAEVTESLAQASAQEGERKILAACAVGMALHGPARIEYPVLALHTLHAA